MSEPEVQKVSDWRSEAAARRATIAETVARLGLSVESDFVPWSRSRNAGEKMPTLNWRVRLTSLPPGREPNDRSVIVETLYTAGCGFVPGYKPSTAHTIDGRAQLVAWCETGRPAKFSYSSKQIAPDALDVLYSLVSDVSVLDAGGFESWAGDFGFDPDSRKAEAVYRETLEIALQLRAGLGEAALAELREAFQDF